MGYPNDVKPIEVAKKRDLQERLQLLESSLIGISGTVSKIHDRLHGGINDASEKESVMGGAHDGILPILSRIEALAQSITLRTTDLVSEF